MSGDIVNLRQRRKQRERDAAETAAAANRAKFGQTKVARRERSAEKTRVDRALDGRKLTKLPE